MGAASVSGLSADVAGFINCASFILQKNRSVMQGLRLYHSVSKVIAGMPYNLCDNMSAS